MGTRPTSEQYQGFDSLLKAAWASITLAHEQLNETIRYDDYKESDLTIIMGKLALLKTMVEQVRKELKVVAG